MIRLSLAELLAPDSVAIKRASKLCILLNFATFATTFVLQSI